MSYPRASRTRYMMVPYPKHVATVGCTSNIPLSCIDNHLGLYGSFQTLGVLFWCPDMRDPTILSILRAPDVWKLPCSM